MRLYPGPTEELAATDVHADLDFSESRALGAAPYVAINMVSTLDGKVSVGGKASPIGSAVDRLIMRNIRCAVDAVLVGAGTVRAEEMNLSIPEELADKRRSSGLPGQPLGVILAGTGELPLNRKIFRSRDQRIIVVASDTTPETTLKEASELGVCVLQAEGSGLPQPREVLRLLKERMAVGTVLLEGGPRINASFLSSGDVHELFLTVSPKIHRSHRDTLTLAAHGDSEPPTARFDLASIHSSVQESELYLRYRYRHQERPQKSGEKRSSFRESHLSETEQPAS